MSEPYIDLQAKADQLAREARRADAEGDKELAAKLREKMDELYEMMLEKLELEAA